MEVWLVVCISVAVVAILLVSIFLFFMCKKKRRREVLDRNLEKYNERTALADTTKTDYSVITVESQIEERFIPSRGLLNRSEL